MVDLDYEGYGGEFPLGSLSHSRIASRRSLARALMRDAVRTPGTQRVGGAGDGG